MSKLFNTLEKIKNHEKAVVVPVAAVESGKKQSQKRWTMSLVFIVACVAVVLFGTRYFFANHSSRDMNRIDTVTESGNLSYPEQIAAINPTSQTYPSKHPVVESHQAQSENNNLQEMILLNNQGARLVSQGDHWQGIYFFDQARKMRPERIEPLINLAVALSELQLVVPAQRFFDAAVAIDPDFPQLKENLSIIANR